MSTGTGNSFVFPVRSLLSGNILPAAQEEPPPADNQSSRRRRIRNLRGLGAGLVPSPNFTHYPGDDAAPEPLASFVTAPVLVPSKIVPNHQTTSPTGDNGNLSDPDSLYTATAGTGSPPPESSPRHQPTNFFQATSDIFSDSAANLELFPPSRRPQLDTPVDMSDTSIVHLTPTRNTSRSAQSQGTPTHSGSSQHTSDFCSTNYSSCSSSQYARSTPQSLYGSSSHVDDLDGVGPSLSVYIEGSLAPQLPSSSSVNSDSDVHEMGRSGSTSGYPSNEDPLVTFRFEHLEDCDGHHVVIGREGKLSRCEDEVHTSTLYILSFQTELTASLRFLAHKDSRFCAGVWCARCRAGRHRWRQACRASSL